MEPGRDLREGETLLVAQVQRPFGGGAPFDDLKRHRKGLAVLFDWLY